MSKLFPSLVFADDLHYNLKSPCADCPFRRDAPDHAGIVSAIPGYLETIAAGRFGHSCHCTDPSADGFKGGDGPIEFCAGSLQFLLRSGKWLQKPIAKAIDDKRFDVIAMEKRAKRSKIVFKSVREMLGHYIGVARRLVEAQAADPQVYCVLDPIDPPQLVHLSRARAEKLDVLECRKCGAPATSYDLHWPYHQSHNFCDEHNGQGLGPVIKKFEELEGELAK